MPPSGSFESFKYLMVVIEVKMSHSNSPNQGKNNILTPCQSFDCETKEMNAASNTRGLFSVGQLESNQRQVTGVKCFSL